MNIRKKSWQIDRRTMLRGMSATIALPMLDAMVWENELNASVARSRKRFCAIYFPFGVPIMPETHRLAKWNWFPKEVNGGYEFREIMKPLNELKEHVTVYQGFTHGRNMGAHCSADGFLTGTPITGGKGKNTISIDQVLAEKYGDETRFPSMVLSINGGIGAPSRSNTLSYNKDGVAIPSQSNLRRIFNRLFSVTSQKEMLAELRTNKSILDDVLASSKALVDKVGKQDKAKLDQYLTSVRELEKTIQRQEAWIGKPLPEIDASRLALEATLSAPADYIRSMFELIFLAFQTDMTRYATFQIGNQKNGGMSLTLAKNLGMKHGHHNLAHSMNKDDGPEDYGKYLLYLTGEYANFLKRMKDAKEGSGTMLDHTLSLFGCSNSNPTHSCKNLPFITSGGEAMGFKNGQYIKNAGKGPMTNVYATMLDQLGAPQKAFADSTGKVSAMVK